MNEQQEDQDSHKVVGVAAMVLDITVTATTTQRRNFSIPHLNAAEHFAKELARHEEVHLGAGWGPHFDLCTWNGSAAIILSFSAIEAAIDEAEDDLGLPKELSAVLDRAPTLEHAQALLSHRGAQVFDRGAEPFQSAELLRAIRNGLVHPKAEWDDAPDINKSLSKKILGAQLRLSPFQKDPAMAFPHGCMSAEVANWAAATARQFIRQMRARLLLPAVA